MKIIMSPSHKISPQKCSKEFLLHKNRPALNVNYYYLVNLNNKIKAKLFSILNYDLGTNK